MEVAAREKCGAADPLLYTEDLTRARLYCGKEMRTFLSAPRGDRRKKTKAFNWTITFGLTENSVLLSFINSKLVQESGGKSRLGK